jgi:hypothetical protein
MKPTSRKLNQAANNSRSTGSTVRGRCLCGSVEFEVVDSPQNLYQCHCSLCHKQSGSAANAAFIVPGEKLFWKAGEGLISSYVKPTGFRSNFCSRCGSPVPNFIGKTAFVWVPAGLLEDPVSLKIALHLFVGSRASWEPKPTTGVQYEELPAIAEVLAHLHSDTGN